MNCSPPFCHIHVRNKTHCERFGRGWDFSVVILVAVAVRTERGYASTSVAQDPLEPGVKPHPAFSCWFRADVRVRFEYRVKLRFQ